MVRILGPRRRARILLVLYIAALAALVFLCSTGRIDWNSISWRPANSIWIVQVAVGLGSSLTKELLVFLGLAVLTGAACAPADRDAPLLQFVLHVMIAFGLSSGLALGASALMRGAPIVNPTFVATTFLALTCLWGSWLGATWMRTSSNIKWMFNQILLAILVTCGGQFHWHGRQYLLSP